ncbi:4'-phosphopantetheinyl transferase superfamily protein [Methylosoma difficile]
MFTINSETLYVGYCKLSENYQPHPTNLLDQHERSRANKLLEPYKTRYVEAHERLRLLLGDYLQAQPDSIKIVADNFGKPYLPEYPHVSFNLSHSHHYMVIALSKACLLGIDIEFCQPRKNLAALAKKCFSVEEFNFWNGLDAEAKTRSFYQLWTKKEAFVKATGRGIALGLKNCVINFENQQLAKIPPEYGEASAWHLQEIEIDEEYCCAVASNRNWRKIEIFGLTEMK